jgi:hypothetical protein
MRSLEKHVSATESPTNASSLVGPVCYKPRAMRSVHFNVRSSFCSSFCSNRPTLAALLAIGFVALGCESGGVGDPCTPEDEYFDSFSGFSLGEVNVESRSFKCETRVCLVNKFQGRVSCPYGTKGTPPDPTSDVDHGLPCEVPGFGGYVSVPVAPQRTERPPELAVYCSCRCGGKDPNARYCECPSGFECTEIVSDQNQGQAQLAGSYCIRAGSNVDPVKVSTQECSVPDPGEAAGPNDLTCGIPPAAI